MQPIILIFWVYKAIDSTHFLPGMVHIGQVVAEKWATEKKIDTYGQIFLLYKIQTVWAIILIFRIHKATVSTHLHAKHG